MRSIPNSHSVRRRVLWRHVCTRYPGHAPIDAHRSAGTGPAAAARGALLALAVAWLAAAETAEAAGESCPSPQTVSAIADAETLVLADPLEGTSLVRLAGITVAGAAFLSPAWAGRPAKPEAGGQSLGRAETDPAAAAARRMIAGLTGDRLICLEVEQGGGADRYGRLPAQVHTDEGVWLQGSLLARGLARVRPEAQARRHIAEMLSIEEDARAARRGLWRLPPYRVHSSDDVGRAPPGLQIVQGRVLKAERRGDWWYLNFGADWRNDFTVTIGKQALADFERAGVAPFSLEGRAVRVRGVLQRFNGPMIEVLIPEQIEVINAAGG